MFTDKLTFAELVSIVMAAPSTSSVGEALNGGWSREAHLLANLQEGNAGLSNLDTRYDRPGTEDTKPSAFPADSMTWDELDVMLEANYALGASSEMR